MSIIHFTLAATAALALPLEALGGLTTDVRGYSQHPDMDMAPGSYGMEDFSMGRKHGGPMDAMAPGPAMPRDMDMEDVGDSKDPEEEIEEEIEEEAEVIEETKEEIENTEEEIEESETEIEATEEVIADTEAEFPACVGQFGPFTKSDMEKPEGITVAADGTCTLEEFSAGFDGFWSTSSGDGHEDGLDEAIANMLNVGNFKNNAKVDAFLVDMAEIANPVDLDYPGDEDRADNGVRAANIRKASAACTKLITVVNC